MKAVQYLNRIGSLGHINHAPLACQLDADFVSASANGRHGFEVRWHQPKLHLLQLKTSSAPKVKRETRQSSLAISDKFQRFHFRNYLITMINAQVVFYLTVGARKSH